MSLDIDELDELRRAFSDVMNYDADDPTEEIDPLTYRAPDGDTCLHIAAMRNELRAASLLLKAGLDVNARGDMGATPLHYANRHGHRAIVNILLEHGADATVLDDFGKPAYSETM